MKGEAVAARRRGKLEHLPGLDAYVRRAMAEWRLPGVALAVVQDDEVVLAKGFGRREVGSASTVDRGTLFQIASCGKAFTAMALGMLVDERKLSWDDPVADHLPDFRLADPYLTEHVTVRDLLTHRTGLPRADAIWISAQYERKEILRRLRYLRPVDGLRARFIYQNLMYVVAGEVVSAIAGASWDDFVRRRIFRPLRMRSSRTNTSTLSRIRNVAAPHALVRGRLRRIPRWQDPVGSGDGSIVSCAKDMAHWLRFQLGEGVYDGRRLVRRETFREMHTPQMLIRPDRWELDWTRTLGARNPLRAYGFGWFLMEYDGLGISRHAGGIDGMSCVVMLVPEEQVGVAVLTNLDSSLLYDALAFRALDACIGRAEKDWSSEFLALVRKAEARERTERRKREAARVRATKPAVALRAYTGAYEDDYFGRATVELRRNHLTVRYGKGFVGRLQHWHYDTFRVPSWQNPTIGSAFVTFTLDSLGWVEGMRVEVAGDEVLRFTRFSRKAGAT